MPHGRTLARSAARAGAACLRRGCARGRDYPAPEMGARGLRGRAGRRDPVRAGDLRAGLALTAPAYCFSAISESPGASMQLEIALRIAPVEGERRLAEREAVEVAGD